VRLHSDGRGAGCQPVRRYHKDGLGPREPRVPAAQEAGEFVVLDGVHWASVPDEKNGHPLRCGLRARLSQLSESGESAEGGNRGVRLSRCDGGLSWVTWRSSGSPAVSQCRCRVRNVGAPPLSDSFVQDEPKPRDDDHRHRDPPHVAFAGD
jgi:hypothetical protein